MLQVPLAVYIAEVQNPWPCHSAQSKGANSQHSFLQDLLPRAPPSGLVQDICGVVNTIAQAGASIADRAFSVTSSNLAHDKCEFL